jgi:hypothetical protein
MRTGVFALVVVAAAIAGTVAVVEINRMPAPVQVSQHVTAQTSAAPTAAPANAGPMFARGVRRANDSYHRHRHQFVEVSDYSERARRNWIVGLFGFAVFVLLTLPKNTRGVRAFYRQMMEASPLSGEDRVTAANDRQARELLFFYLLFLLYQIVQYPLTFGRDNLVQFVADLAIQTALLFMVIWAFHRLKLGMRDQWRNDPARREKMDRWLDAKLAGMNIRWGDVRKLAVGVFIVGFTPAALAHLTGWLDALTNFAQRFVGN